MWQLVKSKHFPFQFGTDFSTLIYSHSFQLLPLIFFTFLSWTPQDQLLISLLIPSPTDDYHISCCRPHFFSWNMSLSWVGPCGKKKEFQLLPFGKGGLRKSYWLQLSPYLREKHEKKGSHLPLPPTAEYSNFFFFFFGWAIVYAGARTPELKVTKETGYHLGQQAWSEYFQIHMQLQSL